MSLLTLIATKDKLRIACDSRASDKRTTLNDEAQKIRQVKGYTFFTGGIDILINSILAIYENTEVDGVEEIQRICRKDTAFLKTMIKEAPNLFADFPELKEEDYCGLFIMFFENGSPKVYRIASHNNYEIENLPLCSGMQTYIYGCQCDEAIDYFNENAYEDILVFDDNLCNLLTDMYKAVENYQVGGATHIYILNNKNVLKELNY